ncbi:MAG: LysM peptidoglycan-binding domain-containing protein [Limisphaerales bacterium]
MSRVSGWLCIVVFAVCFTGCTETAEAPNDEQNPHFQRAHEMINAQDFKGAVAEFEKVLEKNPRSAATHYELGWICENDKIRDYAAAIYHYRKHLELNPDSAKAAQIHERIGACRRELANGEYPLPTSQNLQKEADRLNAENLMLKQQLDTLRGQLAMAQLALTNQAIATANSRSGTTTTTAEAMTQSKVPHTYQIQSGDTITGIASRFKLKTSAVLAANPKIRPERLRVGQNINLPVQ